MFNFNKLFLILEIWLRKADQFILSGQMCKYK